MQISNAEWRVMKIIWMEGKQTSTDLIAVLSERFDWSKSTIKTLLTRLVEKGLLDQRKIRQSLCLLGFVEAGPEFRLGG